MKRLILAACATLMISAAPAHAVTTTFDGGHDGVDPLGNEFHVFTDFFLKSRWVEATAQDDEQPFNPNGLSNATGTSAGRFIFTLDSGVDGGILDSVDNFLFDGSKFVIWSGRLVAPNKLVFTAPAGEPLNRGDLFSIQVLFSGRLDEDDFHFTARWDDASAVPEPVTWSLMIAGFGLAGASLRRHRRVSAA